EIFDFLAGIPGDDPFWDVVIGDPGPDLLFDIANYFRGGMTLHALRLEVGDDDFFRILRRWATTQAGGNVTTDEFIALAEDISREQLDELFEVWLFTPEKPAVLEAAAAARVQAGSADLRHAPVAVRALVERLGAEGMFRATS
ncbi:MAG: M1 family peptidase, partial [Candidatus Limnocylindria bacterium]